MNHNESIEYAIRQAALDPNNPGHGAALHAYALLRLATELLQIRTIDPHILTYQRLNAADEEVEKYIRSRGYLG